jgi:hypothetical protein
LQDKVNVLRHDDVREEAKRTFLASFGKHLGEPACGILAGEERLPAKC